MPPQNLTIRERLGQTIDLHYESEQFPNVRAAFERLRLLHFSEVEIHDLCVNVLATEYFRHIIRGKAFDEATYARMLQRLPLLPWDDAEIPEDEEVTERNVRGAVLDNPHLLFETTEETLQRYQRLRAALTRMHNKFVRLAARELTASAYALGVLNPPKTCADITDDNLLEVVANHTIYANAHRRAALIDAYRDSNDVTDADEAELLDEMEEARFCLLRCDRFIPDSGTVVQDMLRGDAFILNDIGLAKAAIPGLILATEVIRPYGLEMSTGGALVVPSMEAWDAVCKLLKEKYGWSAGKACQIKDNTGELATRVKRLLIAQGSLGESTSQPKNRKNIKRR